MGREINYCYKCQVRLLEEDFESGEALRINERTSCRACAGDLMGPMIRRLEAALTSGAVCDTSPRDPPTARTVQDAASKSAPQTASHSRSTEPAEAGWRSRLAVYGFPAACGLGGILIVVIGVALFQFATAPSRVARTAAAVPDAPRDTAPAPEPVPPPPSTPSTLFLASSSSVAPADPSSPARPETAPRSQAFVAGGLVGWWPLDESGGTAVADTSGCGHGGVTLGRPVWHPREGRVGGALELDGVKDAVRIPRHPDLEPPAVTIMMWARLAKPSKRNCNLFRKTWKDNRGGTYASYAFLYSPGRGDLVDLVFLTGQAKGNHQLTAAGLSIPETTWVHLAGAYNPFGVEPRKRFYVDGRLVASASVKEAIAYDPTSTGDLYIGQNGVSGEWHKGWIDDVRVYTRGLAEAEIRAAYEAGAPQRRPGK